MLNRTGQHGPNTSEGEEEEEEEEEDHIFL